MKYCFILGVIPFLSIIELKRRNPNIGIGSIESWLERMSKIEGIRMLICYSISIEAVEEELVL